MDSVKKCVTHLREDGESFQTLVKQGQQSLCPTAGLQECLKAFCLLTVTKCCRRRSRKQLGISLAYHYSEILAFKYRVRGGDGDQQVKGEKYKDRKYESYQDKR